MKILEIKNLSLSFVNTSGTKQVLKNISFSLEKAKTLGIVGESGSGKSLTALSVLKLLPNNAVIDNGNIFLVDQDSKIDLLTLTEKELVKIRGNEISMVFQEPMTSLNPSVKCGKQVVEVLTNHERVSKSDAKKRVIELFDEVKLPDSERIYNSYPHEISGGQKQRVMIAMAIVLKPKILIADEPTTALDVTVQKAILDLLKEIQKKYKMSIIFISHDLGIISRIADDILVMYGGEVAESGRKNDILTKSVNSYTKGLLSCRPALNMKKERLPVLSDFTENSMSELSLKNQENKKTEGLGNISDEIILKVNHLSKNFIVKKNFFGKSKHIYSAVNDMNFELFKGETLGLVGESGCGKTTLGRMLVRLIDSTSGLIEYKGRALNVLTNRELKNLRRNVQIIFQDPYSSLNPKHTIGDALLEPLIAHKLISNRKSGIKKVYEVLEKVKLQSESFYKFPHEFSGGERQRIVIARALILQPQFIICDESVSALDVSVQAEILNLLNDLKKEYQLTYIFISHDLAVVKYMSDRIMVMKEGRLIEINEADELYRSPASEYTKKLIGSIPEISLS
ncbi:MAG: ABC transporter ATP-binding protein [Bacteroidales bacterium]|nr:ABC transporter ATP-binding protein [Bacteroidales bacterium]